jgi:hypothetical protein
MVQTTGQLLPLAACVALSSIPIMIIITILLAGGSVSSVTFLVGWAVGMFMVLGVLSLGATLLPAESAFATLPLVGWVEIVIGSALVVYGAVAFATRRSAHTRTELPRWLRAIGTVRPVPSLALALALNVRPKALLVSSAAALVVGSSPLVGSVVVGELLIFVAIGTSSVLVPVVVSLARPRAMRRPLEAADRWITLNSRTVTLVAALLTGVVVIGHGMTML